MPKDTNKPIYLNDHWTLDDGLGFGATAEQLARVALQAQPPFTVALTGKWGAGKTSVLRQAFATLGGEPIAQALPLEGSLSEENEQFKTTRAKLNASAFAGENELRELTNQCLCVWYSPWQHQQADNPLLPLLLEIKKQYSIWAKSKKRTSDIGKSIGRVGLTLLEKVVDASMSIAALNQIQLASGTSAEVAQAWQGNKPELEQLSDGQRFHLIFEEAIETLLQSRKGRAKLDKDARLIIFIDDLDRCEESVIVQLLESIKLYLHSQRCVFILGIDPDAVLGALKRHWKERSEQSNAEYLEKLVQAQLEVPQPAQQKMEALIANQLKDHGIPTAAPAQAEMKIDDLVVMLERLLEPNPRKVKNFLNSLSAHWRLLPKSVRARNAHLFVLFHYLRLYHRPAWRLLSHQSWTLGLLYEVLAESKVAYEPAHSDLIIRTEEQEIARAMLARAFSHVLADKPSGDNATPDKSQHRNMPLEQAVQLFTERLDRKRSDQYFINYFRDLVRSEDVKSIEAAEQLLQQMNQAQDGTPA